MNLFDMLKRYKNSAEVETLQGAFQTVAEAASVAVYNAEANMFVVTSDAEGLAMWERYLGIPTDTAQNATVRKEVILSKMRGYGTTTVQMIKTVSEAYANGEVDVTEDNAHYTFSITFISQKGKPQALDQLKAAIDEIKPAHLGVNYIFIYTTHDELTELTHNALAAYTHEGVRV